ncbi:hypothetical protein COO60DRAFT_59654 [Scenedesmus sp. NREL 46B-D3]|nr:hypothetical protein COO60DRAFT_59654 [Scenedesmus sp. NREL 46B-D3]
MQLQTRTACQRCLDWTTTAAASATARTLTLSGRTEVAAQQALLHHTTLEVRKWWMLLLLSLQHAEHFRRQPFTVRRCSPLSGPPWLFVVLPPVRTCRSYVLWKVVARHLPTPQQRTAFCAAVGAVLLQQLAPEALTSLGTAAAAADRRRAPAAALIASAQQLLDLLQRRGYICGWQLVLGSLPGGWPADWSVSEQQLAGLEGVQQQEPLPPGLVFQVKLQQPADIEGCVSLRQEEDGFWSRHISSMLAALLAAGGYSAEAVDEYFYQDSWQGPSSAAGRLLLLFGDPLQQVDVPWTPTTLVQDWTLA